MKIFFDVDLTILYVDAIEDALRPGVREAMEGMIELGHGVYVWSAGGKEYSERTVKKHGLTDLVTACFDKDVTCPVKPDFVIDDDHHLVSRYRGFTVTPYRRQNPRDKEMLRVLAETLALDGSLPDQQSPQEAARP